jgi:hypothetical protein
MKKNYLLSLAAIAGLLIISGCDQRIARSSNNAYQLQATFVKNLDKDSLLALATLHRNDTATILSIITVGSDTLKSGEGYYRKAYNASDTMPAGNYFLRIKDENFFDSVSFAMPGDFRISSISLPDSRINPGGNSVQLEITSSAGSNGYVVGAIKKNYAYLSDGFSQISASLINVPIDAFRNNQGELDTGWYYIYVYAYSGSPTIGQNLPTSFPSGFAENIARTNLGGYLGAIVVSRPESTHVVVD